MNKDAFIQSSQNYLANLLSSSHFNLEDGETFSIINEPYDLDGKKYQIYPFKQLTGYTPDSSKTDEVVLYTFYILKADDETKSKYRAEVEKKKANQEYNEGVIGAYYANLVPSFEPFNRLTLSLGKMLQEHYFSGKGYNFAFHMATVTADYDIALIFLQLNSLEVLETKYPGESEVVFNQ